MDEYIPILLKVAASILGVALTLGVGLLIFMVKRMYKSIDLLFAKLDAVRSDIDRLKLMMVSVDPSKTAIFKAFMEK